MQQLQYPIDLKFKIGTLANDFVAKDALGQTICYVRQKMFKLVDEIIVFKDESKQQEIFRIKANKWLDFSVTYTMTDAQGQEVGKIARKGWKSIWKASYDIFDEQGKPDLHIQEENPWAKVGDAFFNEIPLLGLLTGYIFNPSYILSRPDGVQVARLKKRPSFFGRHFQITQINAFEPGEEQRIILGMLMMILLERRRG